MKVRYTVIDGEVVSEVRGGVRRDYVPDSLGSTIALLDGSSNQTDTWEYWPYGEVRTRTGTTATPFQFVGTLGYYRDSSTRTYIRARHYKQNQGRWLTVDPLWPMQLMFAYAENDPVTYDDYFGLQSGDTRICLQAIRRCKVLKKKGKGACRKCMFATLQNNCRFSPLLACEVANTLCGTKAPCTPCGSIIPAPGANDCGSIDEYARYLHEECGGEGGADKLAHCYSVCMHVTCFGTGWAHRYRWPWEDDELDKVAEDMGYEQCACTKEGCLECCARTTKNLPSF